MTQLASKSISETERRFFNRDLSWIEFNRRVLALATDRNPLLERVKFLAIFSSNLDEFVMKRIGWLRRITHSGLDSRGIDGLDAVQQFEMCRGKILELVCEQGRLYEEEIVPGLAETGIHVLGYSDLSQQQRDDVDAWYRANVFPVLTPLSVDPGHRFPFISNLSHSLGVIVAHPEHGDESFARVKIPNVVGRMHRLKGTEDLCLVPLAEIVKNNLDDLFPGMEIREVTAFRVTRNAAVEREEEDVMDLVQAVEDELRERRFADAIRLEVEPDPSPTILRILMEGLRLGEMDVYERRGPLDYAPLMDIANLKRPELRARPWRPVLPARLADEDADIFSVIRERDVLVHHPYESFTASVERFVDAAAHDPDVLAIKLTLYRTSGESPFVDSLIRAAESGKQAACLVEVRARFDERRNVRFARELEKAGVHVAYGVLGLKTHCKCSLVVRRESDGLRCYAHLGTGNYNSRTAQQYTDLGLLTCDPRITGEVVSLFNYLTGRARQTSFNDLLVAPVSMRERFTAMIDREIRNAEAGRPARIMAKMNQIEDRKVMEKLYEASCAGVQIDLIVRGFCCLRPGVPGMSENIRVISVVGRFLEHARIFHFADGQEDPVDGAWYLSSADWMYRNLNNRVESATPIKDRTAREELVHLMQVHLNDGEHAWDLGPEGTYAPSTRKGPGTFETLMELYR